LRIDILDDGISSTRTAELTELNIYPNPSSDIINIELNSAYKIERVEIYSLLGSKIGMHISNSNNLKINTSDMTQAVYYLKIKTSLGELVRKITVL